MSDEAGTQPTLETVVRMLSEMRTETRERLDRIETLLDRVAGMAFETRADVRELRGVLKEHFPFVK